MRVRNGFLSNLIDVTPSDMVAGRNRRRYTLSVTASWKPPDSNARVAASKLREERSGQPLRCRIAVKWIGSGLPLVAQILISRPEVGSIANLTSEIRFAGIPPCLACSRTISR